MTQKPNVFIFEIGHKCEIGPYVFYLNLLYKHLTLFSF